MEDRYGLLPPDIRAKYEREEFVDRAARVAKTTNYALKCIDERLSCVLVRESIPEDQCPAGAIPGRWHVRRLNDPPAMPTYMPILGPDGGYRDPDVSPDLLVRELHERDLRRPGAVERAIERGRVDNQRESRAKALETEQRQDEIRSDFQTARRMTEGAIKDSYASRTKHKRKKVKA